MDLINATERSFQERGHTVHTNCTFGVYAHQQIEDKPANVVEADLRLELGIEWCLCFPLLLNSPAWEARTEWRVATNTSGISGADANGDVVRVPLVNVRVT
jgi:hypothetical protein